MENRIVRFTNCTIVRDHEIRKEDLWIRNGKIIDPEKIFFDEKRVADQTINCDGALISPGFIDIQINGGFGIDFSYDTDRVEIGVAVVAKGILAHGVTSFCPTVVTSQPKVYYEVLPKLCRRSGGPHGATVLGAHVEGPFINKLKKGAHDVDTIIGFEEGVDTLLKVYGNLENIRIITLAPELNNAGDVIEFLVKKGITVSLGHSTANLSEGLAAVKHGASLITHLFNAMLPFHHRDPGLVGLLSSDIPPGHSVYYGIIADGVHTHPAALRIAQRTHPKGLVLVTDAISALGLEEGIHHIGQLAVQVRGGCAFVEGTNTLCGSIATLNECIVHFRTATGCSTVEALEAATKHPAEALGIYPLKGSLNFGADADFAILRPDDLHVISTWIAGQCVYQRDGKEQMNGTRKV